MEAASTMTNGNEAIAGDTDTCLQLGMSSHKKSQITIFGHKHEI